MIEWFAQEHPASCVAACLRIVFSSFAQLYTEQDIRRLLGNPRFGITLRQAALKLSNEGATMEWHSDWGIDDLRECLRNGNYPIVGIERHYFGRPSAAHAVVLVDAHANAISMLDPLEGPDSISSRTETFISAWHTAGQEALVLISPGPHIVI